MIQSTTLFTKESPLANQWEQFEKGLNFYNGGTFELPYTLEVGGVIDPKEYCTYNFVGYELYEKKCKDGGVLYLIAGEYSRVSRWLYKNHYPLWLYYNYLNRISASVQDIHQFADEFKTVFNPGITIQLEIAKERESGKKEDKQRSYCATSQDEKFPYCKVFLIQGKDRAWNKYFKEKKTGFNVPELKDGVMLNTTIHEYAHALDYVRKLDKHKREQGYLPPYDDSSFARGGLTLQPNPFTKDNLSGWKPSLTHQTGFLTAIMDILVACREGKFPIVADLDSRAIEVQKRLATTDYGKEMTVQFDREQKQKQTTEKNKKLKSYKTTGQKIKYGWFGELKEFLQSLDEDDFELVEGNDIESYNSLLIKLQTPSSSDYTPSELSMLNDLIEYWEREETDLIIQSNPTRMNAIQKAIDELKFKIKDLLGEEKEFAKGGKTENKVIYTPEFKAWFGDWESAVKKAEQKSKKLEEYSDEYYKAVFPYYSKHGEYDLNNSFKGVSKVMSVRKPTKVFHGTHGGRKGEFTVFNPELDTYYFSNTKATSETYGHTVLEVYLDIKKPFIYNANCTEWGELYHLVESFDFALAKVQKTGKPQRVYREWAEWIIPSDCDGIIVIDIVDTMSVFEWDEEEGESPRQLDEYERWLQDKCSTTFIVHNPNQIKLADGSNTTFDPTNPDIRFSKGGKTQSLITKEEKKKMSKYSTAYMLNDKGNMLYPKGKFFLWLYDDKKGAEKLYNNEYEPLIFPFTPSGLITNSRPLEKVFYKTHTRQFKGGDKVIAIIEGILLDKPDKDGKRLYIQMMSVKKPYQRKGINSFLIKGIRESYNLSKDEVEFVSKTKMGKQFAESGKFDKGGVTVEG